MEKNLENYVRNGGKLPSDGGLFDKICDELKDYKLHVLYDKKVYEILRSKIFDYFWRGKNKAQEIQDCVDLDKYLSMTIDDLREAGPDFFIPISNKVIYHGEKLFVDGHMCYSMRMIQWRYIEQFIPNYVINNFSNYNCPLPPLPLECIYSLNQMILDDYVFYLEHTPRERLMEEESVIPPICSDC